MAQCLQRQCWIHSSAVLRQQACQYPPTNPGVVKFHPSHLPLADGTALSSLYLRSFGNPVEGQVTGLRAQRPQFQTLDFVR